jgi:pimeloyl-ACP methyl ester carboxylesterase
MRFRLLLLLILPVFWQPSIAADSRTFDSDGVTLRYLTAGAGDTVVLLHGFSGSAQGLYVDPGTFDALVASGYRVVALDQRGHGESDKPYGADDSMGGKVSNTFRATYPNRLLTVTLGGYGWPWHSRQTSLAEAEASLQQRMVLPGNDLKALAAVSVGMYDLTPDEVSLRANSVPAFAIIGDKDEVVSVTDRDTLRDTMAHLEMTIIPGTHAGPDGAPYKPVFAEKLLGFLNEH